jgi:hypothetical protein
MVSPDSRAKACPQSGRNSTYRHVQISGAGSVASWADVVVIASLEADKRTLARVPEAILLSPLHPLRLSWHSLAQSVMSAAAGDKPCPAAGILDPKTVPDFMRLPVHSPEGLDWIPFLSVESNSDYWSVLWNGNKLHDLPRRSQLPPFEPAFGLAVGGISSGFSASQVARALDDVSNVLCAKPIVSVAVSSAGGTTDSCNQGLIDWSAIAFADQENGARQATMGRRRLDVFDMREENSRPDEATVANLSDDTANNVRWHFGEPKYGAVDLGIIAQLDSSEPETAEMPLRTPLGAGALLRHRIRRQLPNAFLSESRQAQAPIVCGNALADKLAAGIAAFENAKDETVGLRFAPNVYAISDMLEHKAADFVAISSSAVDPACFLGGWFAETYLWDYDLPSYSQRAGDTNGYYVLSKLKSSDRDRITKVLARLPNCGAGGEVPVGDMLLEVARRGIPTIRGLSGDDTGATGDLGLFVASRLLQDRFRLSEPLDSLLPVIGPADRPPMEASFCVETLEDALARHGKPEVFNTDQGSQFTSQAFTGVLTDNGIAISMDGKGAWRDNVFVERLWRSVKYEEVYLRAYDSVGDAKASIGRYLGFYNGRRPHSSLDDMTPDQAYFTPLPLRTAA